jgi:hypothetical protein
MHKSQSLFYLTTALHVSGVTITHLQENKTIVITASGNSYTVIERVKFIDKKYRQTRLKLQLLNNVYSAENLLSWKSWHGFECVVGGMLICFCFHVVADVSSRQQYGYVYHSLFYRTYRISRRIYIIQQL